MPALQESIPGVMWRGGLEDGQPVITGAPGCDGGLGDLDAVCRAVADPRLGGILAAHISAFGAVRHLVSIVATAPQGQPGDIVEAPLGAALARLAACRTTSPALTRTLARMRSCCERHLGPLTALELCARLLMEARRIQRAAGEGRQRLATHGAALLPERGGVLIQGTVLDDGSTLACVLAALAAGRRFQVWIAAGHPTASDTPTVLAFLRQAGATTALVGNAAMLMAQRKVQALLLGSTCIGVDGGAIGDGNALTLAILAHHHGIPVLLAAPSAAIDRRRAAPAPGPGNADALRRAAAVASDAPVWTTTWDLLPAPLIAGLITERGVLKPPLPAAIAALADDGDDA